MRSKPHVLSCLLLFGCDPGEAPPPGAGTDASTSGGPSGTAAPEPADADDGGTGDPGSTADTGGPGTAEASGPTSDAGSGDDSTGDTGSGDAGSRDGSTGGSESSTGTPDGCDLTGSWAGEGSYYDSFDMMEHTVPVALELTQHDELPPLSCFMDARDAASVGVTGTYNGTEIERGAYHAPTRELCLRYDDFYVVSMTQLDADCDTMSGFWATEGFEYEYEATRQ